MSERSASHAASSASPGPSGWRERGSALILMPAALLVLLILGAISVDSSIEYLGHRQLADFTASAADDAAAKALDRSSFYAQNARLSIDQEVAQAVVDRVRSTAGGGGVDITDATAEVSADGDQVTVRATGTVHGLFGPAVGGQSHVTVRASSGARVHEVIVR